MAAFLGEEAEGRALLRPLRELGPQRDSFATVPPVVLGDLAMDPLDPLPLHSGHALLDELPAKTIDAVLDAAGPDSGRGPTITMLQFRQTGGALAREAPGAGVRASLPGTISMFTLGVVPDEAAHAEVSAAVADVVNAVASQRVGHYPNFVEKPADASAFFAPEAWARLREIKARYDGGDLFTGNHHIPLPE
jgi:FAD/FMN-containing dehydrogenase